MEHELKLYRREKDMQLTPGQVFYQRQIAALEAHDLDALMAQYDSDATMVGFDFTVKGQTAIRKHFVGYLERLGTLKLKSTDKFTETEDAIFFEATITSQLGEARVYDVFLLRDGKATHHFSGLISLQSGLR
jgi:SnoaL-like domain